MRAIALDPGKLTGWAAADIDEVGEWTNVEHGILPAKEIVLELERANRYLIVPPKWENWPVTVGFESAFKAIIYEDWVLYRAHAEEYIGSDMPYSQQIGQYRLISWLSGAKIYKQPAARKDLALRQARAFWPELAAKVEDIMQRSHKDAHDGDALLHLFGFTVDHYPIRKHESMP